MAGIATASIAMGGSDPDSNMPFTETWNGTNWTNESNLNSPRYGGARGGSSTAALFFGGHDGTTQSAATEAWDGTGFITKTITTTTE